MPQTFEGLTASEAKNFAAQWLPAWTGNDPDLLASFYAEDCFYSDRRWQRASRAGMR
jgi:ketosteroid isomerase-like protein